MTAISAAIRRNRSPPKAPATIRMVLSEAGSPQEAAVVGEADVGRPVYGVVVVGVVVVVLVVVVIAVIAVGKQVSIIIS